jgi:clan AA aspartic protease
MGEVRVRVRLTNASDEALARRGQLPGDQVRSYETDALVDTGAVSLVIPADVMRRLGLMPIDRYMVTYADGRSEPVEVTEPVTVRIDTRRTADEARVLGDEVLIGQTVLEIMDLVVDTRNRCLIQNPRHPDGPLLNVKRSSQALSFPLCPPKDDGFHG